MTPKQDSAIYSEGPYRALRFNTKKVRPETRNKLISEWSLRPVPWCCDGYYYDPSLRPGLSPYHAAGVYYIQEPSAMMPAEIIDIPEGTIALDLCAAPGGKATRLLEKASLALLNDPIEKRARVLSSNIERMGFTNSLVTCAYPDKLENIFPEFFDLILVDAPCSGEGLFRKKPDAVYEWSKESVRSSARRQSLILSSAYKMLSPGGSIIYSTCTFEEEENEKQLRSLIGAHDDLRLLFTKFLSPKEQAGEGQFAGVVKKDGLSRPHKDITSPEKLYSFMRRHGGENIHVMRCGLIKGKDKQSHAEAMAKCFENDSAPKLNLLDIELALRYLRGESLRLCDIDKSLYELYGVHGFLTVYFDSYPLGNAKLSGAILKNHLPKGLRFH